MELGSPALVTSTFTWLVSSLSCTATPFPSPGPTLLTFLRSCLPASKERLTSSFHPLASHPQMQEVPRTPEACDKRLVNKQVWASEMAQWEAAFAVQASRAECNSPNPRLKSQIWWRTFAPTRRPEEATRQSAEVHVHSTA